MTCPNAKELLEITAENAGHIAGCAECQTVIATQEEVTMLLDSFECPPVSLDFNRRLWHRIGEEPVPGLAARLMRWVKPAIPLAVGSALVAAAFVYDHPGSTTVPARVSASEAEKVERALDDIQLLTPFEKTDGDPAV